MLDSVSLYLHIPFCHAKCHYCDFNSYAGMLGLREPFRRCACATRSPLRGARALPDGRTARCRTIFFGGGTPSLLTAEQVARLLDAARAAFAWTPTPRSRWRPTLARWNTDIWMSCARWASIG